MLSIDTFRLSATVWLKLKMGTLTSSIGGYGSRRVGDVPPFDSAPLDGFLLAHHSYLWSISAARESATFAFQHVAFRLVPRLMGVLVGRVFKPRFIS